MGTLTGDIVRETIGRRRLAAIKAFGTRQAAGAPVRYRVTTPAIARQTCRAARRAFLSGLRELGRKAFLEMQLSTHLLSHFAPTVAK